MTVLKHIVLTLCYLLQLLLCLPELSKIESSNFLSIFNLFLVSSGLVLQLLYQLIQSFKVLLLFLTCELQLFYLSVSSDGSLVSLR